MSVRGYGLTHIRLAVEVEKSGLATPDFLDQKAAKVDKHYLRDEELREKVEMARHFIFDELAMLEHVTRNLRLMSHLMNFTNDKEELDKTFTEIVNVYSK